MPTVILIGVAVAAAAVIIPTTLMLAPKGGVSAGTAAALIETGSSAVERRIQAIMAGAAIICALACVAVRFLA